MAEYTVGLTAATNLTPQVWVQEIKQAVYEAQVIASEFDNLGKSGEQIHVRRYGALGRTSLATGSTASLLASQLTLQSGADTEVTASPTTIYLAVGLTEPFIARMMQDPTNSFRMAANSSVAEGVDVSCGTLFDDLTSVIGGVGQDVTEPVLLDGIVVLRAAAKALGGPGNRVFIFHYNQLDDVIASTQNWSQYQITGREGPVSTGELKDVYGCRFKESGNIQNIGGLFHNGLFVPKVTFGIGYNMEPTGDIQKNGLTRLVIIATDFVVATIWPDRGADYNTQTPA